MHKIQWVIDSPTHANFEPTLIHSQILMRPTILYYTMIILPNIIFFDNAIFSSQYHMFIFKKTSHESLWVENFNNNITYTLK